MNIEPIVCRRCAVISRGIVGHCSHVQAAIAAERERCAKIAENEKVDAEDTGHASDIAYNDACNEIAKRIMEA